MPSRSCERWRSTRLAALDEIEAAHMARRHRTSKQAIRIVQVGDRVRFKIGALEVVADVVEDHGAIGAGGRRLLSVAVASPDGEIERFDVPAADVTILTKDRAAT
jgi:hypothetical protein